jgi:hypothetical protein
VLALENTLHAVNEHNVNFHLFGDAGADFLHGTVKLQQRVNVQPAVRREVRCCVVVRDH